MKYGNGVQQLYMQGCAVSMRGQFWYFGGYRPREVRKSTLCFFKLFLFKAVMIMGCQIVRLPDLPFYFQYGSCNTFKPSEEKALMCFGNTYHYDKNKAKACFM